MADELEQVGSVRSSLGQKVARRWREVVAGVYAPENVTIPSMLQELWTDGTLLAAAAASASGWIDLSYIDSLRIGRASTGGTYALEVDWSRDGAAVDLTQALTVTNDSTGELAVAARFARFRVRNTDGVAAFTAHRTNVFGR